MAGFIPNEGLALRANMIWKRVLTDRDATLELGLFTNSAPGMSITEATITEPTGTGYTRKTLTDANWSGPTNNEVTYAAQEFKGGAGGWSGSIQGYFIASVSSGGTQRILAIEVDENGPYTLNEDDTYTITPSITELTENDPT